MMTASQLRIGMAIRYEGQSYKVLLADCHPGQGKMGGTAHARLKNLETGTTREHSFRAELKLEDLPVEILVVIGAHLDLRRRADSTLPVPADGAGGLRLS